MQVVDFHSDTRTLPTPEMRRAMAEAEVGDDGSKQDPTVNRLEEEAAERLGKEAALFVSSGTQGNLVSRYSPTASATTRSSSETTPTSSEARLEGPLRREASRITPSAPTSGACWTRTRWPAP